MMARAESSVFWPGITPAITAVRTNCNHCNRMASSQPSAPPTPPPPPCCRSAPSNVCAQTSSPIRGSTTLSLWTDSNWSIIDRTTGGAKGLIDSFRSSFVTYGIPVELVSDGGPEFTSTDTRHFLSSWGVHHRLHQSPSLTATAGPKLA